MPKKKKPSPISMKLHKTPPKVVAVPTPETAPVKPFNAVSPITDAQMRRAEKKIDVLSGEVKSLRNSRVAKIDLPAPVVNIQARARITKVTIKYDQLGFPSELIPQYTEA